MSHRNYVSADEDVQLIAGEVAKYGHSNGWNARASDELQVALEVEKRLARFNIGYTDDSKGHWAYRQGGTRHFNAMRLSSLIKSKVRSAFKTFKR